MKFQTVCKSS